MSGEPNQGQVGAFMGYDQQGVALFFGGGGVLIIPDDLITRGNASEMTPVQRAVLATRLREVARLIETGEL